MLNALSAADGLAAISFLKVFVKNLFFKNRLVNKIYRGPDSLFVGSMTCHRLTSQQCKIHQPKFNKKSIHQIPIQQ